MPKFRFFGSIVALYLAWFLLDFIMHGHLLMGYYEQTAQLWRPEADMKFGLMQLSTLLKAAVFAFLYFNYVAVKSKISAMGFGFLVGLIIAMGAGIGTFTYMPIPGGLALAWFGTELFRYMLGGWIVNKVLNEG